MIISDTVSYTHLDVYKRQVHSRIRERILEEFILSKNLYIMNEESDSTTFSSRIRANIMDLTVVNNKLIKTISEWEIKKEETC